MAQVAQVTSGRFTESAAKRRRAKRPSERQRSKKVETIERKRQMADRDDKGAKRWRQKSDKGKRLIGTQRRGPSKSVQKGRWNKACCPSKESTVSPIWDFKWILARSAQSRRAGTSVEFHRGAARALADGKVAKAFLQLS